MTLHGLWFTHHFCSTIVALSLIIPIASPVHSQQPVLTCNAARATVRNRLARIRNLRVRPETSNIAAIYPDHPVGRPNSYTLIMQGAAIESVFNSRQLMTTIATEVITACDTIGLVTFARDGSGEAISVGLFPGGSIDVFKCAEDAGFQPGLGVGRPTWGLRYCSI
ncbi:MAG: hypothetical protein NZ772_10980 [Cyanobacteria bacterium]|nr:hypothetical protein [Cyanobacteriota bacterium]MDW8201951.1 hypothetical protein [Cyanobacteriota bacterium SKYGB_h_bin112]